MRDLREAAGNNEPTRPRRKRGPSADADGSATGVVPEAVDGDGTDAVAGEAANEDHEAAAEPPTPDGSPELVSISSGGEASPAPLETHANLKAATEKCSGEIFSLQPLLE